MPLDLSPDQSRALEQLLAWVKKPTSRSITLGGYAGTGKTTLISVLRRELLTLFPEHTIAFAAFTGKASQVLRITLEEHQALFPQDSCTTIHKLLYTPSIDKEGRLLAWKKTATLDANLLIIDEASMITDGLWMDLCSFGIPIIAIGDHGQLPPIGGSFNLLQKPDITLERIHRQAEGNPILRLAEEARQFGRITPGTYAKCVRKFSHSVQEAHEIDQVIDHLFSNYHEDMLILCGRNRTRVQLNQAIRAKQGRESAEPEAGEKVVCLKNIYSGVSLPIYNGMTGIIERLNVEEPHWYQAEINFGDDQRIYEGRINRSQFHALNLVERIEGIEAKQIGDRFDFGYALTVHKAQGSQAKTVILFEERFEKADDDSWRRWLYTAVTRARENLYIIGN